MSEKSCAYCGKPATEKEHVFPKCLYPLSKKDSKVQRLTIPACSYCNGSWQDDEVHFRNVILMAGEEPNNARQELIQTKVFPSFKEIDGRRRLGDVLLQIRTVQTEAGEPWRIYPGKDERVLRVVRKVIRGLCHYHGIMSPVSDKRVWVDVLKYRVPPELLNEMEYHHREKDIAEYRYQVLNELPIDSAWLITFFERCTFIGVVSTSEDGFPEDDLN